MQTELLQKDLANVGEAISHELGAQMISDYQVANPNDVKGYYIGRNIIDQILAQPGCVGIRFFNAYNEEGRKTLVYIGVDQSGKEISQHTVITEDGNLIRERAIVGDRANDVGSNSSWFDDILTFITSL